MLAVYNPELPILKFIPVLRDNFNTLGCRHDTKRLLVGFVGLLHKIVDHLLRVVLLK